MGVIKDNVRDMELELRIINAKAALLMEPNIMPDHIAQLAMGEVVNSSTDCLYTMQRLIALLEVSGAEDVWHAEPPDIDIAAELKHVEINLRAE